MRVAWVRLLGCKLEIVTLPGVVIVGVSEIVYVKIKVLLPGTRVHSPLALPVGRGSLQPEGIYSTSSVLSGTVASK